MSRASDFAEQCVASLFGTRGQDMPNEPSQDELRSLAHVLGRRPTTAEENDFMDAWDAAYQVKAGGEGW